MNKAALVFVGLVTFAVVTTGQGPASDADKMQALVTEMRAMRADLNRVAGASIRSQLLVGRLQLQEERILTVSRQLAEVQDEIAAVQRERAATESEIKRSEEAQHTNVDDREQLHRAAQALRSQVTHLHAREQQLQQKETSLSALLADEQARWTDFSSRLDELERALMPRR